MQLLVYTSSLPSQTFFSFLFFTTEVPTGNYSPLNHRAKIDCAHKKILEQLNEEKNFLEFSGEIRTQVATKLLPDLNSPALDH